ncbi:MAG: ribonuclease P protein component [Hyphomicrobiales bacterium]
MDRLKKRSDFLRVARGHKQVRRALVLQAWQHQVEEHRKFVGSAPRLGFTVTKKVGNAVVRNRVRRRLKEAVRLLERRSTSPNDNTPFLSYTDYVVVGRLSALTMPFADIQRDLESAAAKISRQISSRSRNTSGEISKKAANPGRNHSPSDQNPLKEQPNTPNDIA